MFVGNEFHHRASEHKYELTFDTWLSKLSCVLICWLRRPCVCLSVPVGQQEDGPAHDQPVHRQRDGETEGGGHRLVRWPPLCQGCHRLVWWWAVGSDVGSLFTPHVSQTLPVSEAAEEWNAGREFSNTETDSRDIFLPLKLNQTERAEDTLSSSELLLSQLHLFCHLFLTFALFLMSFDPVLPRQAKTSMETLSKCPLPPAEPTSEAEEGWEEVEDEEVSLV